MLSLEPIKSCWGGWVKQPVDVSPTCTPSAHTNKNLSNILPNDLKFNINLDPAWYLELSKKWNDYGWKNDHFEQKRPKKNLISRVILLKVPICLLNFKQVFQIDFDWGILNKLRIFLKICPLNLYIENSRWASPVAMLTILIPCRLIVSATRSSFLSNFLA